MTSRTQQKARPRRTPPASRRSFPIMWVAIGVVVVLGIVAIALSVGSGGDESSSGDDGQFGTPDVSGEPLPRYVTGAQDPAVGEIAPTVRGENFAGEPTAIEPGRPRMVVFLAHWCPHCNAEAPRLASFIADPGIPDSVDLTIVPTGSSPEAEFWPPSDWLDDVGLGRIETLVDDEEQTVASAFGLSGYPFIVMLDAEGRVVQRVSGEQPEGFFAEAFTELTGTASS
jgi:cytochrome c biogenesis protein CcmG/thiol:disulfide interchange protein DsbE